MSASPMTLTPKRGWTSGSASIWYEERDDNGRGLGVWHTKDGRWTMRLVQRNRASLYEATDGTRALRGAWRDLRRTVECTYLPGEVRRLRLLALSVGSEEAI